MKKLFSTIIILFLTLFFSCSNPDENELNEIEELKVEMKGIPDYLSNSWLCVEAKEVDDLDTEGYDKWKCQVELTDQDGNLLISSTGIPNHDFESGPGCCAQENEYQWIIPGEPAIAEELTWAPNRGAIAITVTGVPIFGPEEGPGGDAVALHFDYFEEDRQPIVIGVCGGHSAGTIYHYHFDANCIHWHEENPENSNDWKEYDPEKIDSTIHSPIIGFAFDGFPIYGPYGWDEYGEVIGMTTSYKLKDGENGYNGIDSWEYTEGLGTLDECNGHFFSTPEAPKGIYHYHSTSKNGDGLIGFPYFLLCYKGIVEESNFNSTANAQVGPPGGAGPPGIGPSEEEIRCLKEKYGDEFDISNRELVHNSGCMMGPPGN